MPEGSLKLAGMAEFRAELRAIDKRLPKGIQKANKRAAQLVTDRARTLLAATGGVGPRAAGSIKALAGQAYAAVRLGGPAWPFAAGQNFGSQRFKQFPPPAHDGDYGLYKGIAATRDEVMERYDEFIDEGFAAAFPEGS